MEIFLKVKQLFSCVELVVNFLESALETQNFRHIRDKPFDFKGICIGNACGVEGR